jgi:magnesium transporter
MGPAISPGRASLYSALEEKLGTAESAGDARYSFFNSNLDTVTHADDFSQLQTTCEPFKEFRETGVHDGLWWLHVASPSDDDIEFLSRMFGLHPLTTEDIKVRELREKVELFGAYYFVSVLPPRQLGLSTVPNSSAANFYGIVFPEGILSITFGDGQDPAHVWKRIKDHQSDFSPTSDWICYALM